MRKKLKTLFRKPKFVLYCLVMITLNITVWAIPKDLIGLLSLASTTIIIWFVLWMNLYYLGWDKFE